MLTREGHEGLVGMGKSTTNNSVLHGEGGTWARVLDAPALIWGCCPPILVHQLTDNSTKEGHTGRRTWVRVRDAPALVRGWQAAAAVRLCCCRRLLHNRRACGGAGADGLRRGLREGLEMGDEGGRGSDDLVGVP